jgi:integrase
MTYLLLEEIESLFRVIKSPRDRAAFSLMLYRGLRASELGMLRLSDWNDDGFLFVRRGKNGISGTYRLRSREARALRAWLRIRGKRPGPLFPTRQARATGAGISRNHLDRLFREYCALADLDKSKAHLQVLKNSCGVHLAAAGHGSWIIRDHLGYRHVASTEPYRRFSSFPENYDSLRRWGSEFTTAKIRRR